MGEPITSTHTFDGVSGVPVETLLFSLPFPSKIRMPSFRNLLLIAAAGLVGAVFFFLLGAVAHKKCVPPFCQGLVDGSLGQPTLSERVGATVGEKNMERNWRTDATHLYDLSVDRISLTTYGRYGAIDTLGTGLIVAANDGTLTHLRGLNEPTVNETILPFSIPVPHEEFAEAVGESPGFPLDWFGVKDLLVLPANEKGMFRLFAAYHQWSTEQACASLRIGQTVLRQSGDLTTIEQASPWTTVFETTPCVPLQKGSESGSAFDASRSFNGHMYGGRIAKWTGTKILVSVGDPGRERICTDAGSPCSFGKILEVDYVTGRTSDYSTGHRNPQGLHVDASGLIWSTEHGARGGDELNWIRKGADYGWPQVSYGTDYGSKMYEMSESNGGTTGSHAGYTLPTYAWVPGKVGISQLTSIQYDDLFERWDGDLLAASLSGKSLYRMRVRENRVVLAERIRLGTRIRDLVQRSDGTIVAKSDAQYVFLIRPAGGEASEPAPDGDEVAVTR